MRFPPSFLDELRARLPVSEVVGRRVRLKKAGREWKGLSPFNKERTPSFTVNDQKGFFHDFSSGKHGDIFRFIMETEGLSFFEAVERLAAMAGVPLPKMSPEADAEERRKADLYEVLEIAAKFFESNLAARDGAKARGYLADRGILPTTQLEFRLGYAPPDRFALKEHLGAQGIPVEDMIKAGLLIAGDDIPIPYDRFRDRVIIPIHDQRGRVIGFGGRTLRDDVQPKYLNSPDTELFHKGSVVFNFHRARQPAHQDGSVVVVEGYMDAIAIYQGGLRSVVASMGTAFTEEQIKNLWRLATEPLICFDSDAAGVAAAYRAIDRILPELTPGRTFRFAFLQDGKDPDELIREKGMGAFKSILEASLPLWNVLWRRETNGANVESPDRQAALEQRLTNIIRTVRDSSVRVHYERTCRVELAQLFWETQKRHRDGSYLTPKGFVKSRLAIAKDGYRHGLQKILLGLLVHYPGLLDEKRERVAEVNFSDPRWENFRRALYQLVVDEKDISVHIVYSRLKPEFYQVLEDVHGEGGIGRKLGHCLLQRFPIVETEPPEEFVSRCIDHFVECLKVEQVREDIQRLVDWINAHSNPEAAEYDEANARLVQLVRQKHLHEERITREDSAFAEEAKELRRLWAPPPEWPMAA